MQYRFVITYRAGADSGFDWDYYMQRHLPLAVGTSLKHAAVTACDADQPLSDAPDAYGGPFAAICEVYFEDLRAREDFRGLFTGHADAEAVIADEPNYTRIKPDFIGCDAQPLLDGDLNAPFRLRWMQPQTGGAENFRDRVVEPVKRLAAQSGFAVELATGSCGIPPGSSASCSHLLNVLVPRREDLDRMLTSLSDPIAEFSEAGGEFVAARRLTFDLELARRRMGLV